MKFTAPLSLLLLLSSPLTALAKSKDKDEYKKCAATEYLADVDSIKNTIAEYAYALDLKEYERLDAIFTANATYTIEIAFGTVTGAAAIKAKIAELTGTARVQHLFATESLKIDSAAGTAQGLVLMIEAVYGFIGPNVTNSNHGYWIDTFERTRNGDHYPQLQWRFASREFKELVRPFFLLFLPIPRCIDCKGEGGVGVCVCSRRLTYALQLPIELPPGFNPGSAK